MRGPIPVICLAGDVLMKLAAVTGMVLDRRLSFSRPALSQRIFKAGRRGVLPGYRHACASLFCGSKARSEEHTSELQSLMRSSYSVFCLNKKKLKQKETQMRYTELIQIT